VPNPGNDHHRVANQRRDHSAAEADEGIRPQPVPATACAVCSRILNHHLDRTTGSVTFTHPAHPPATSARHDPVPVPAATIDAIYRCDFCSSRQIVYRLRTRAFGTQIVTPTTSLIQHHGENWMTCWDCAPLVDADNVDGLLKRAMAAGGWRTDDPAAAGMRMMIQTTLDGREPGRTIVAVGQWPPTAPKPGTLPRVRDRLLQLILSGDPTDPSPAEAGVREHVGEGLTAARLYWVDPHFTDLANHAATDLPDLTLPTQAAPAPHGFLAWAQPVGSNGLVAASWTVTSTAVVIVCYRSIGDSDMDPASLQRLREQVGWLVPRSITMIRPEDLIGADSPAALVVTTWLLIAQKLAETTPTEVDRTIRKAYQRSGRTAPEVRLVRIRGTATPSGPRTVTKTATGDPQAPDRQYRWWVRGHWRNQAYGPGWTLRRPVFIDPQIRGPEGKPLKADTTVRILAEGGKAARTDPA
jgi:hypothetical protein